jgi:large subunit ribosomal protein L10
MAKIGRLVKEAMVGELAARVGEQPNLFITAVRRLSAADSDALRQKLIASQARLRILKRSLGKRLLAGTNISGLPALGEFKNGSLGFVLVGEDALPVAKHLVDFIKDHADHLILQGGFVEGQVFNKQSVELLASLPPKPALLAQVVFTIESPIADVAFTVERLVGDVCWIMEQLADKKAALPAS